MLIFALEFINLLYPHLMQGMGAFGSSKHMFERILHSTRSWWLMTEERRLYPTG